jgi:hypothetical protein
VVVLVTLLTLFVMPILAIPRAVFYQQDHNGSVKKRSSPTESSRTIILRQNARDSTMPNLVLSAAAEQGHLQHVVARSLPELAVNGGYQEKQFVENVGIW